MCKHLLCFEHLICRIAAGGRGRAEDQWLRVLLVPRRRRDLQMPLFSCCRCRVQFCRSRCIILTFRLGVPLLAFVVLLHDLVDLMQVAIVEHHLPLLVDGEVAVVVLVDRLLQIKRVPMVDG